MTIGVTWMLVDRWLLKIWWPVNDMQRLMIGDGWSTVHGYGYRIKAFVVMWLSLMVCALWGMLVVDHWSSDGSWVICNDWCLMTGDRWSMIIDCWLMSHGWWFVQSSSSIVNHRWAIINRDHQSSIMSINHQSSVSNPSQKTLFWGSRGGLGAS